MKDEKEIEKEIEERLKQERPITGKPHCEECPGGIFPERSLREKETKK